MSTYSNDPKQTMWEMWFVTSVIVFLATMFVGTIEGSVQMFPHFDMWLGLVFLNLVFCIFNGLKQR